MKLNSFIAYIKQKISTRNTKCVEASFDISKFELDKSLPRREKKKMTGLMEDGLRRNIMIQFIEQRLKLYNYLTYADSANIKVKETKMCNNIRN